MTAFWINHGGTWRKVTAFWINHGGTWRKVKVAYLNKGGTYRKFFAGSAQATNAYLSNMQWDYAELTLNANGSTNVGVDWAQPNGSAASELWVKFTLLIGAGVQSSFALEQWARMNVARTLWVQSNGGAYASAEGSYAVSTGGNDATIIGGGNWYLSTNNG